MEYIDDKIWWRIGSDPLTAFIETRMSSSLTISLTGIVPDSIVVLPLTMLPFLYVRNFVLNYYEYIHRSGLILFFIKNS